MLRRFVAIGECMVEMAPRPDGSYLLGFAGDTFNTAWYARRVLGAEWEVGYLTAVGMDAVSARMLGFMQDADIETAHVAQVPERTVGLYMITLTGAERSFAYWRSVSAARMLADDPGRLTKALAGAEVVYVSGITFGILAPDARRRLMEAMAAARARGALVVFDPNLRPGLWGSVDEMCAAVSLVAEGADIILPSHEDEARYFGDADVAATVARYGAAGLVVVKDGPGDVLAFSRDTCPSSLAELLGGDLGHRVQFSPPRVKDVIDTTAAGDSFNAGFLGALLGGEGLGAAMARGAALAGRVIGARGALVAV